MACRYPDARSPDELWENVLSQRRAFRRIPPERLRVEDYAEVDGDTVDRTYLTQAAVLDGWDFDRTRFRIAGSTYRSTDLTHWLALEVAADALADSGWPDGDGLARERTGVIVGNTLTGEFSRASLLRLRWPYVRRVLAAALADEGCSDDQRERLVDRAETMFKAPFEAMDEDALAGGLSNTIAGRIANAFDLGGGGYTVDGACAASLLAITNACSALTAGDLDVVLAGGVDLSLDPFELVGFAKAGAFARDVMRVYDRRSNGFWPGEGCGFVVLERLEDTLARGARASAVIRGWGISSDGAGSIIRPRSGGQQLALARAYRRAGFGAGTIELFEGHGTGTTVGDDAELTTITQLRLDDGAPTRAAIGSVKANIGHTKAAAGVAGLIKATMSLRHRVIPPMTGCERPHELLTGPAAALRPVESPEPWPHARPGRAAVSAMGFGGINTHVVLEGAPGRRRASKPAAALGRSAQDAELLVFGAPDVGALAALVERVSARVREMSLAELGDLAATLHDGLPTGPVVRAAVIGSTPAELAGALEQLSAWLCEDARPRRVDVQCGVALGCGRPDLRVGLLFTGQGAAVPAGGGALARRLSFLPDLATGTDPGSNGAVVDTSLAQPAIVSASLIGLALVERLGLAPSVAVGHSLGELTALHWAGSLSAPDVRSLAAARGRAMSEAGDGDGAMASIAGEAREVAALVADAQDVVVSGYNARCETTISGRALAVEATIRRAREAGLAAVRLPVSHAFHSQFVEAAADRLRLALDCVALRPPVRPVASTVTGSVLPPDADVRALLVDQVTRPVRFEQALGAALGRADALLEVGPGDMLARMVRRNLETPAFALDAGGPSVRPALEAAGMLWALGAGLVLGPLFAERFTRPFSLDRPRRFLANPCERAPLDGEGRAARRPHPPPEPAAATREPPPTAGDRDPLAVLRRILAERTELPEDAIGEDTHLLGDLHLTSIAVSELAAAAVRELDCTPLPPTTEFANATVGSLAAALAAADGGNDASPASVPDGVADWVRAFASELADAPPVAVAPACSWTVVIDETHPLGGAIRDAFAGDDGEQAILICLPPDPDAADAAWLLRAGQRVLAEGARRCAFLQHGGGACAFAKTLHLEHGQADTCVIDLPADATLLPAARRRAESACGFSEVCVDEAGACRSPVLRPFEPAAGAARLGTADVVLISGGGRGIGAECALALARTGARVGLLGRSHPDADAELAGNLRRLADSGVRHVYEQADVCDGAQLRRAVARIRRELGEITAVVHCAGVNAPARIPDLDGEAIDKTLAPKVAGLRNLLGVVEAERLSLLVTFGSIIARTGLRGEAHYALANDWMALEVERLARELPRCRCLNVEWSVWTGAGMGERLGTVAALAQGGVAPIPLERGLETLLELVSARSVPGSVVVAGRFGTPPTVDLVPPELPMLRFVERVRVHYPAIELVVEADVSRGTDPYLDDHVIDGTALLPVVFALEAMASVARALTGYGPEGRIEFADVRCSRAVTVPAHGGRVVRLAALARRDGAIEIALRSDETGYQTDHVRATCRFDAEPLGPERKTGPVPPKIALDAGRELYGGLLFQGARFQRIENYRKLAARSCIADVRVHDDARWYGDYLPQELALGDPGARDAVIHAIQPCIPQARVVPVGVKRIRVDATARGTLTVHAIERERTGDSFVYDVVVSDADGRTRERWDGLALRRIGPSSQPDSWPVTLLAPYLERRAGELSGGDALAVALTCGNGQDRREASDAAIAIAAGPPVEVRRAADGRPLSTSGGSQAVSAAHLDGYTLAVAGRRPLACDIELSTGRNADTWNALLGGERMALAELVSADAGEDDDVAATRVWAATECVKKAGLPIRSSLKLDSCTTDGWVLMRGADAMVATYAARVHGLDSPVVIAMLSNGRRAS